MTPRPAATGQSFRDTPMKSLARIASGRFGSIFALVHGSCLVFGSWCPAGEGPHARNWFHRGQSSVSGGSGGFQGFGLSYHLGHGYGGDGWGVGACGGYPAYGGPGYPHCEPSLQRFAGIEPFLDYGGPGHPRYGLSHYFEVTGPLQVNPSVVEFGDGRDSRSNEAYGPFTGAPSYPADMLFAPYSSRLR